MSLLRRCGLNLTIERNSAQMTTPADFARDVSGQPGRALRSGLAQLEGFVCKSGRLDESAGSLSGGGQRASGSGRADGGAVGLASGVAGDGGPRFDQNVPPGGYAWWYVDAFSEDQQFGLSIIAFVGSVFSPYYAWSGRRTRSIIAR